MTTAEWLQELIALPLGVIAYVIANWFDQLTIRRGWRGWHIDD